MGEGLKSSHYGLYVLGYTRVTKVETKSHNNASLSESRKTTSVRIVFCNSKA